MYKQISHSPYELIQHHSCKESSPIYIETKLSIKKQDLEIHFQVGPYSLNDSHLSSQWDDLYYKNWQLWEGDVVEFYIQFRSKESDIKTSYYEFQLNPLNKKFVLKTIKPRKINWTPMKIDFQSQSEVRENFWKSIMKINLESFDERGSLIYGNFHACLGDEAHRSYWSAFHTPTEKADFHRPEQFQILFKRELL